MIKSRHTSVDGSVLAVVYENSPARNGVAVTGLLSLEVWCYRKKRTHHFNYSPATLEWHFTTNKSFTDIVTATEYVEQIMKYPELVILQG